MMYLVVKVFFVAVICSGFANSQDTCPDDINEPYSYNSNLPNGPPNWGNLPDFPMCNGRMQSPVNIETSNLVFQESPGLQLRNYDKPITNAKIENDGHTVKISPNDSVLRTVLIDGTSYALTQFHFHWGNTSKRGSEHTVDGRPYSMELHLVHENSNGDVAVVGVFLQESFVFFRANKGLEPIVQSLDEIPYKNDVTYLKKNLYLTLLVDNGCSFYRYQGSLTTPPCSEGVIWTICKRSQIISRRQIKAFRDLYSAERNSSEDQRGCKISNNYRPIQPLNGRQIVSPKQRKP